MSSTAELTPEEIAALPHEDYGPRVLFALWFTTPVAFIFLCLRVYCKRLTRKPLWWDDRFLLASWVLLLCGSCIWTIAVVKYGYGHHSYDLTFDDIRGIIRMRAIMTPFAMTAAIWSKVGFAVTLLRLTTGWMKGVIWFFIITVNITLGFTTLISFISCDPIAMCWDPAIKGTRWPTDVVLHYHLFSGIYAGFVDIALSLLPWKLVWSLQMQRKEKIGVATAMSMGIFAGATSIVKAVMLQKLITADLFDAVPIAYWSHTEVATCIVAASIPVLRVLLREKRHLARKYYKESTSSSTKNKNNTVCITASRVKSQRSDDRSDKSILDGDAGVSSRIVTTNEVSISYQDRKEDDSIGGYEMEPVKPV